ncbi:MAG TPA: hypothetical protein VFB54_07385 [Burkholderiales bacterium]|nr:hypothetical protein [Burkholderiales bacterium]
MSVLARIAAYFESSRQRAREHRRENLEYASALIAAERRYWMGFYAKAATQADRERAEHELAVLEERSRELRAA